ncbi:hypothetical protein [Jannaschia sp. M317]|uniref:hypothetical protein n=1 Tax=Jannaschia sp. M317 TaxID=2867011 RepID=UPI0021A5D53B|nr:hypothetical protein [Jannaschia sp. M317]UWQ19838.1 hypothetical protein K3551_19005 [Jannaschia sp. M317]
MIMAKRRKLATPSQDDLTALEDRFRDETPVRPNTGVAPIAQVVAEAAQAAEPGETARRVEDAEAGRYREAEAKGLILKEISLAEIDEAAMIRDRTVVDATDLAELRNSIDINGLRLPIEVFERSTLTPGEAQDPTAPAMGCCRATAVCWPCASCWGPRGTMRGSARSRPCCVRRRRQGPPLPPWSRKTRFAPTYPRSRGVASPS